MSKWFFIKFQTNKFIISDIISALNTLYSSWFNFVENFKFQLKNRHQDIDIDYNKHQRTFQRLKRGVLPENPLTVGEMNAAFAKEKIFKCYGQTLHIQNPHRFFDTAIETKDYSFSVFSSKATIELITANIPPAERHILMDATFRILPVGPFKQLLILYVRKQKQVSAFIRILRHVTIYLLFLRIFFSSWNLITFFVCVCYLRSFHLYMRWWRTNLKWLMNMCSNM